MAPLTSCRSRWELMLLAACAIQLAFGSPIRENSPAIYKTVVTTSGTYVGHGVAAYPDLTEYLGIPYAESPIGALRFAAPVPYHSDGVFEASSQPSDCPYVAQPWGSLPDDAYSHASRIMAQESADGYNAMSGDCLRLNIWTPSGSGANKTVMVWLYGGGFDRGSINNPAYIGAKLAVKQDVVVVSFKCADSNVALRDVRLAIEWVRDNIASFGGNPESINLFGQSQGAYLISYYAYAFANDSIASSFIQQSGSAFDSPRQPLVAKAEYWRNASRAVGCNNASDTAVLQCMRAQNVSTILAAWTTAPGTTDAGLPFGPAIDGELVFSDYADLTTSGRFAQKPFLMGSNDNEAGFYVLRFAGDSVNTSNQTSQDLITFGTYVCSIAADAANKSAFYARKSIPIYRYEYFGNWPNLALYPGSNAYHTSETSVVFGTMEELSGDPNTQLEVKVSEYMQSAWAAFAKNPMTGLDAYGWPKYDPATESLIRLGHGEEETASFVSANDYDALCSKL